MSTPRRRGWPGATRLRNGYVLYWWAEILAIVVFYALYSLVRNGNEGGELQALTNAERILDLQQTFGIAWEETLQDWALQFRPLIIASNYFYGSFHFVATIGAGVFLFRWWPNDYPLMRNALAIATLLALVGFVFFPLMPPRLMEGFGYVDTLEQYPTLWSFNSGAINKLSNQFAAMPSVHVAWALWTTIAFVPRVRASWAKGLAIAYPIVTIVVIVLTANHFILDAVGGAAVLLVGFVMARVLTRAGRRPIDGEGTKDAEPSATATSVA